MELNLDRDTLRNFGGFPANSLLDVIGTDPLVNNETGEIKILRHSPYYQLDDVSTLATELSSSFSVLSINIQSINAKIDSLRAFISALEENDIHFAALCIQESWLRDDSDTSLLQIENYQCISQGYKCSSHGGLIIYLHNKYNFEIIDCCPNSNTWEGLFISIFGSTLENAITLGNVYKPPRNNNNNDNIKSFIDEFSIVLQSLSQLKSDCFIAGDFNINLLKLHEREIIGNVLDTIISHSFYPKITLPTRFSSHSCSLIDNIYCKLTPNSLASISGIFLSSLSDHLPYFTSVQTTKSQKTPNPSFVKIRDITDENIKNFISDLSTNQIYDGLNHTLLADPNENYNSFIDQLQQLKDKHLPTKLVKFNKYRHKKNKWITSSIIKSIKNRDILYANMKKTPQVYPEHAEFKAKINRFNSILKKLIRQCKKDYYSEQFLKYKGDMKNTWKTISNIIQKNQFSNVFDQNFLINGKFTSNLGYIVNKFNEFFVGVGPKLANTIDPVHGEHFSQYLTQNIRSEFKFQLISEEHLKKTIASLKSKSSSGVDGISTKLLKQICPGILKPLTLIINQSLTTGIFPYKLKIAKIFPLHKKEATNILDNYRPISLLTALSKVFEKVVFIQVHNYFKVNLLFHRSQYGFRLNHSTEYAILEFVDNVINDIEINRIPLAIFLDLSKAFDTLNHTILLSKLNFYGIQNTELLWFKSYLSGRTQLVEINNVTSDVLEISTGVPQGSILGPLLFIIYMNDICNASNLFKFVLFADDTNLSTSLSSTNQTLENFSENVNLELNKIRIWLSLNKLSLNVSKTKYMLFRPKNKILNSDNIHLQINDIKIQRVTEFNFLGLQIDDTLSWKSHTAKISHKIAKFTGVLCKLKHYLPPHILKTLYCNMVQSHLLYCNLAWGFNCSRVVKIQKKAMRIICNAKYNSHTEPLFKITNLLKIPDLFRASCLSFYHKFVNGDLPQYFQSFSFPTHADIHNYPTRHNDAVVLPQTRTNLARKRIRYHIASILNNTPHCILDKVHTHSRQGFNCYVKQYLLKTYSVTCNIRNCRICGNTST
jgi:hypothetical protein